MPASSTPTVATGPARRAAFSAVGYTVLGALPLFLMSSLAVELQRDLGFDRTRLGLCISAYFLVSSLASAPLGPYLEGVGPSAGMRAAALLSLVVLLGIAATAGSWVHLALFLAGSGLANALAQVSSNLALANSVPLRRQGIAFGFKQAAVPLASVLAGVALPAIGLVFGWRWAFAGMAAAAAAGAVWRPRLARAARSGRPRRIPRHATLLLLAAAGALGGGIGNALAGFTVDAAVTAAGMGQGTAGTLLAVGSAVAIAARLAWGYLADLRGTAGFVLLASVMLAGSAGFALLALSGGSTPLFVTGLMIGFAGGWGWQGLIYYVVVRSNRDSPGAATALVLSGVYFGTIVEPSVIGHIASTWSYQTAWWLSAGMMAAASAVVLLSRWLTARQAAATAPGS
jgi:MFS family permease